MNQIKVKNITLMDEVERKDTHKRKTENGNRKYT